MVLPRQGAVKGSDACTRVIDVQNQGAKSR